MASPAPRHYPVDPPPPHATNDYYMQGIPGYDMSVAFFMPYCSWEHHDHSPGAGVATPAGEGAIGTPLETTQDFGYTAYPTLPNPPSEALSALGASHPAMNPIDSQMENITHFTSTFHNWGTPVSPAGPLLGSQWVDHEQNDLSMQAMTHNHT
ncbi:hypothetical protein K466DRAFT_667790 [Polyporus arcularius HHB13444]|uniref:Uncharacterized protein n=1 Tax=Polyporus arcularius HHB13444 TaxID=1314778 RepID=A0A5C3NTS5_9APHY|nr:hypothetical protein K466DRAFT_667790 [Polyporus arcularius HHB13444]